MSAVPSRRTRRLLLAITIFAYALMLVPIATVVVLSVQGDAGLSFDAYEKLFANAALGDAVQRSLLVAGSTSLLAAVLGTTGALAIERGRFPGRTLLDALTLAPLVLPELVLGIASLIWFALLGLTLGTISIVLAHTTFAVSYVVVTVRASLRGLDPSLVDAARDLGCSTRAAYLRVVLPLITPGIVGGALMAFMLSFDDFLISFFTAGAGADTLPMKLYSLIRFGLSPEMYALSALLVLATAGVVALQQRLGREGAPGR